MAKRTSIAGLIGLTVSIAPWVAAAQRSVSGAEVRDSGGISIIVNPAALAAKDIYRLSMQPVLDIGGTAVTPQHELVSVGSATRLSNGDVVVVQRQGALQELRVFSSGGSYLRTIGRAGQGPREFEQLDRIIKLPGDTLLVRDEGGRIHQLDARGSFIRSQPFTHTLVGRFGDGSFLVSRGYSTPGPPLPYGSDSLRLMHTSTTSVIDSGRPFPSFEKVVIDGVLGRKMFASEPVIAVDARHYFFSFGPQSTIGVHAPNGRLLRSIRVALPQVRVTAADVERNIQEMVKGQSAERATFIRQYATRRGISEEFSAFSKFLIDPSQRLWAARYRRSGETTTRWLVCDAEGRLLGGVTIPIGLDVLEVGADYILGATTDSNGVPRVQIFRLLPPSA